MTPQTLSLQAKYGYISGLNGIRALSVLIVLLAHMGLSHIIPGGFGVTVFFFISGFLITRLLIAENDLKGRIGLKQFYIRRFIRLYPALLFMVFGTTLIYALYGWGGPKIGEMLSAIFYGTNLYQVNAQIEGNPPFMPWKHLWSLAVEEHFYLLFPAFLALYSGNWVKILKALSFVLCAALIWRVAVYFLTNLPAQDYNYMMTDTRIDSLVWGCVLSIALHVNGTKNLKWLMGYVPVALSLIAILASFLIRDESFRYTARFSVQGIALFILFLNLFFTEKFQWAITLLEWKPLAWFGTISYALYLWHVPIIDICIRIMGENLVSYLMALALSIYAAAFSYYIVEKRFLSLRKAYGSHSIGERTSPNNVSIEIEQVLKSTGQR